MKSSLLLILFTVGLFSSLTVVYGGNRRGLRGSKGNLNPHHDNSTKCNREKLYIEFDNECASDYEDVKSNVKNLVKDNKNCLYLDKTSFNVHPDHLCFCLCSFKNLPKFVPRFKYYLNCVSSIKKTVTKSKY